MGKRDTCNELHNDRWGGKYPIRYHHMAGGKVDARNVFAAIRHEQVKRTTYARAKQNRRADNMNPFEQ